MTDYAFSPDGIKVEYTLTPPYRDVMVDGVLYPAQVFSTWSRESLAKVGFYPVSRQAVSVAWDEYVADTKFQFVGGEFVEVHTIAKRPQEYKTQEIARRVEEAKRRFAQLAEQAREKVLDPSPTKQQVYLKKQREVELYRSGQTTGLPWAEARAAVLGVTVADVIAEWEAVIAGAEKIGIAIETAYDGAVKALEDVKTGAAPLDSISDIEQALSTALDKAVGGLRGG